MANRRKELNLAWRQTNVERKNSIIYSEASKKLANEYDGGEEIQIEIRKEIEKEGQKITKERNIDNNTETEKKIQK